MELALTDTTVVLDINTLLCPITQSIFSDPVVANDGHVYERDSIKAWLVSNKRSPVTGEKMNEELKECHIVKHIIESILKQHPTLVSLQFKPDITYISNHNMISDYIYSNRYDKLLCFTEYDIEHMVQTGILEYLAKNANLKTMIYIFDNMKGDYETVYKGYKLFSHLCLNAKEDVIRYLIDKGINMNYVDASVELAPINYVCKRGLLDLMKYMVDKGANVNRNNYIARELLHDLCDIKGHDISEMFIHIIKSGLNVNESMVNNMTPLLFACQHSLLGVVKFLIKKKANMECEMVLGWRPIHAACYYADFKVIVYIINNGASLTHKIKKFNGNNNNYGCIDLVKLNKRLSEDDKNEILDIIDEIINGRHDNDDDLFDEVYMKKSRWRKNKK